jgi:hypothetical protein
MLVHLSGNKEHTDVRAGTRVVLTTDIYLDAIAKNTIPHFIPSKEFYQLGLDCSSCELGSPVRLLCWTRTNGTLQPGMLLGELFTLRIADPS